MVHILDKRIAAGRPLESISMFARIHRDTRRDHQRIIPISVVRSPKTMRTDLHLLGVFAIDLSATIMKVGAQ